MKWINPETGKLERRPPGVIHAHLEDYDIREALINDAAMIEAMSDKQPLSVQEWLRKSKIARMEGPLVRMSSVGWRDVLTPRRVIAADGTQVLNTTTETIMCPDFTFAADYMEVGDLFKYTLLFDMSTVVTTPGTITHRIRWGGVGGTSLAASGAFAPDPTAAATTLSCYIAWFISVRSVGTAGSMFAMGNIQQGDFDDATVTTLKGNLDMGMAPTSAPAATGSLDTTTAKALSPTVAFSVATATTQLTNHIAFLESLN